MAEEKDPWGSASTKYEPKGWGEAIEPQPSVVPNDAWGSGDA